MDRWTELLQGGMQNAVELFIAQSWSERGSGRERGGGEEREREREREPFDRAAAGKVSCDTNFHLGPVAGARFANAATPSIHPSIHRFTTSPRETIFHR